MKSFLLIWLLIAGSGIRAQNSMITLNSNWQFKQAGTDSWHPAKVPGLVHTDLRNNNLIPDPFYRDNENNLAWIDTVAWEYRVVFRAGERLLQKKNIELVFDGLDTYAGIYLNKIPVLETDNMFRQWTVEIKKYLIEGDNELTILFKPAKKIIDSLAQSALPLVYPDHNRVYARKAQFQFGWDWGPKFISAGIWKKAWIDAFDIVSSRTVIQQQKDKLNAVRLKNVQLIQQPDSAGTTFYFQKDGKPLYAMGANWIPANIFLPDVKKEDYRRLLQMAKDANMNMLRVWGGGIYESDEFYDICDELGIMVWQDFMFAGGMYPATSAFLKNVKQEVKYQVERLRHHPCIVLWCGNNEIDEAWHNWGWQQQFNLHGEDSAKIWNEYAALFKDSLPSWVNEFDGTRPYIASSPMHGWGRKQSITEGDSHYWGLWWGLQDWEVFTEKTGRFVSEYGMQSMGSTASINRYTQKADQYLYSPVILSHQKATDGFKKINHYLIRYFIDSGRLTTLSLDAYRYLTQCMQSYILKNAIAIHRQKSPYNMGTLLWQLNDCWPVTSWSIIDQQHQPKAAWYAVKQAYGNETAEKPDSIFPKNLPLKKPLFTIHKTASNSLVIQSDTDAKFVYLELGSKTGSLSDNYFDLKAGTLKVIKLDGQDLTNKDINTLKIISLYDIIQK